MKTTTRLVAVLALLLFVWYLFADRITPYTSLARVKAIVIEVVPQVSGYVAALAVTNAQLVEGDDLLARIDQRPFVLEVEKARSALQSATQSVGASSSQVEVAQANLTQAEIGLENVKVQSVAHLRAGAEETGRQGQGRRHARRPGRRQEQGGRGAGGSGKGATTAG